MIIQTDPRDWQILADGSAMQREAFEVMSALRIFEVLAQYKPAHVGTIGNGLCIEGSDIDIVCSAPQLDAFELYVERAFGHLMSFTIVQSISRGAPNVVASFQSTLPVEIYCESTPVEEQLGFRHYALTCRLFTVAGEELLQSVRLLKGSGMKTEPALARCLGFEGDPYLSLLKVEEMGDAEVAEFLACAPYLLGEL